MFFCKDCRKLILPWNTYCSKCRRKLHTQSPFYTGTYSYNPISYMPNQQNKDKKKKKIKRNFKLLCFFIGLFILAWFSVTLLNKFQVEIPEKKSKQKEIQQEETPSIVQNKEDEKISAAIEEKKESPEEEKKNSEISNELLQKLNKGYFYSQLDDKMKACSACLYESLMNFDESCTFPYVLKTEDISMLFLTLRRDCPDIMQLSESSNCTIISNQNNEVQYIKPSYACSQKEYEKKKAFCKEKAEELALKCKNLSDLEKEEFFYNYLVNSCIYDAKAKDAENAYGALANCKAKCDGFSQAMQYLMQEVGISCSIFTGNSVVDGEGHAWNAVLLDEKWYMLDVTADIGVKNDKREIIYPAYNVSLSWMKARYTLGDEFKNFKMPKETSMSDSKHAKNGCFIAKGQDYSIFFESLLQEALAKGKASIYLQFEEDGKIETVWNNFKSFIKKQSISCSYQYYSVDDHNVLCIRLEVK